MTHCFGPYEILKHLLGIGVLECKLTLELPVLVPSLALATYSSYFFLTFFIEVLVFLLLPIRLGLRKKICVVLLANLATHPLLTFGLSYAMTGSPYAEYVLVGEALVLLVELLVFLYFVRSAKFWWVFAMNLVSWQLGAWLL